MALILRLTDSAAKDIQEILEFTKAKFGERQKEIYDGLIEAAMGIVLADPDKGHEKPKMKGILFYHISQHRKEKASHYLLYEVNGDHLYILRVLHERMDHRRHL